MPDLNTPTAQESPVQTAVARPRTRSHRSVLRWALALLFFVVLAAGGAGFYQYRRLTSPANLLALVRQGLSRLPCPGTVEQATFSFFGGVEIVGLKVGPCGQLPAALAEIGAPPPVTAAPSSMTLQSPSVRLIHDPWRLLLGKVRINHVIATDPVLDVVGDFKHAARPFKSLGVQAREKGMKLPDVLPTVEVRNGTLRLLSPHTESNLLDQVGVNARARPSDVRLGLYDIAWQSSVGESGIVQYDVLGTRLRDVRGGSPTVAVPAAVSAFISRGKWAEKWAGITQLTGRIRVRDFDFNLRGFDVEPGNMIVEVAEGSLAIPVDDSERAGPPAERLLRPQGISGVADVRSERIEIQLTGQWQEGPLRFSMTLPEGAAGLEVPGEPAYSMIIDVDRVLLPRLSDATAAEQRAIGAVSTVRQLYHELDPSGPIDLLIEVAQAARGRPELARLVVTPRGASAQPEVFPLPVAEITGSVEFARDGVTVESVCGGHSGGAICVSGRFNGLDRCASAELSITGTGAPIDEELYAAMGHESARIREWFNPVGTINVRAVSRRPVCENGDRQPWVTDTEVTLNSIRAKYRDLPYEFEDLTGRLTVRQQGLDIDVAGRAGVATISVSGSVERIDADIHSADLRIQAVELPIDSRLLATIGDEASTQLAPFGLTGSANIESDIRYRAPSESLAHTTTVKLADATIRYEQFPVLITSINGLVHINPDRVVLGPISGKYYGATLTLDGVMALAPSVSQQTLDLTMGVIGLRIDDELIASAPAAVADALRPWSIDGPISGKVSLIGVPDSAGKLKLTPSGEVRLSGVSLRRDGLPAPISNVYGLLSFDSTSLSGADLRATYGRAALTAEVQAYVSSTVQHGRLELSASGVRIDDDLMEVLPADAARRLRRLQPSGYMDAHIDRLQFTRERGENWEWSGSGALRLHSIDLPPISLVSASGDVTFSGMFGDSSEGAMIAGELRLDRAILFDRELTRISTPWSLIRSTAGAGELSMDRIQAGVYDGDLSGRLEVRFDPRGSEYNLTALVQNMQLAPFLNAGRATAAPPVEATGRVAANLYLSGDSQDPQALRGGGRFEVIDGNLYKLPIILAILSVLDISARPTDTFEEATADLYIVGRRITVRDIALRGGLLALVGAGVVTLPDLAVDLRLVNVPDQWWARLPVVAEFMQGAVRELVQVRVTGPISQPAVRTDPVPRITEEIRALFQRRTDRRPLAPQR